MLHLPMRCASSADCLDSSIDLTWRVQVFPEDSRGQYVNKVDFGLVKADLLANYDKPQRDRINVAFEWIRFMLGPLSFKKVRTWDTSLCSVNIQQELAWSSV